MPSVSLGYNIDCQEWEGLFVFRRVGEGLEKGRLLESSVCG